MLEPIGVCVIVVHPRGQILVGKRKNAYKAGWLGFPGGRLEPREDTLEAARRELLEETGLRAEELRYLGVVKEYQSKGNFIHFVYLCQSWHGEVELREPDKCEGWDWLDQDQFRKKSNFMLPGHLAAWNLWQQGLNKIEL